MVNIGIFWSIGIGIGIGKYRYFWSISIGIGWIEKYIIGIGICIGKNNTDPPSLMKWYLKGC